MIVQTTEIYTDTRGTLIPINDFDLLPFIPKRMFTVTNVPKGQIRGDHAHYESEYLIFCIAGKITATLTSATGRNEVVLTPGTFISHPPMEWGSFRFETGSDTMMVFCSMKYDKNDYITSFQQFMQLIEEK